MIDINKLRRKLHSGDIVDHIDIHANVKPTLTELLDRLEAAEKERDALRARVEAMEKQEPAGTLHDDGYFVWSPRCRPDSNYVGWKTKLYLAPGAQEPKP